MADPDELAEVESDFAGVALALFAPGTVQGTLERIVQLAVLAIEGCDAAGVLADAGGGPATLAASSELAVLVHQLQIDAGEGPCLEAAHSGSSVHVADLTGEDRWPRFTGPARDAGIRAVLAHALPGEVPWALNLYAREPNALDTRGRAQALLFATLARLALDTTKEREDDARRSTDLTEALRTRELIGQAQGILMERERMTSEEAFAVLRQASQHLNVKLREVAARLVETGQRPDTGVEEPPAPG